ncbi:Hypothetical predicted protein [Pelobates cultripes]|uniref:Uncharacterized protein n=1 Tax=Pelobates cultripes TaxID=61616 RepID=A0AAD1S358_PELCU|nr:Hypothetical predicted protein [Pelobates cultripes]
MPFLGDQTSEEWVSVPETLDATEVWLDDLYRSLRWHAYHLYPLLVKYKCSKGGEYDGPGLLWEAFETSLGFRESDSACFWSIQTERADTWDLTEMTAIQPDLSFLAN